MEKENMKKTNADKERRKKLTNAILMAFVCILMMSGATYAWFTTSNIAKVTSLKLNVASEGNLYIATSDVDFTADNNKQSSVEWPTTNNEKTLYPCTSSDGVTMLKPKYASEKVVNGTEAFTDDTEKDTYVLEQKLYLYMDDGNSNSEQKYNISLGQNDTSTDEGCYIRTVANTKKNDFLPERCIRISFTVGSTTTIYEPNYDKSNTLTDDNHAENQIDVRNYKPTVQQSESGKFGSTGDSDTIFQIQGSKSTPVTVKIWFEGTDKDCCNKIDLNTLEGQIKFVATKATN